MAGDFSRLDQVLYVNLETMFYPGKHVLIAGGAGSGKTSTLLLLAKLFYDNNETIIWRDDSSLEFLSLVEEVPIKIFIPEKCTLHYEHANVEYFQYKPTEILSILNNLDSQKINAILFDLFCFDIAKFIKFWKDFFYALYKWKRTKIGPAFTFITDEINDLCLTPETLVVGSTAKPISEWQAGDSVLTHAGRFEKVKSTMVRPFSGIVYTVKPRNTNIYSSLTPSHAVLVVNRKKVRRYGKSKHEHWVVGDGDEVLAMAEWVPIENADPKQHFLVIPRCREERDVESINMKPYFWSKKEYPAETVEKALELSKRGWNEFQIARSLGTPRSTVEYWIRYSPKEASAKTHRKVPNEIKVDRDFMRLIGYYVSEGHVNWNGLHFSFHKKEVAYHEDVSNIIKKISFHHVRKFEHKDDAGVDLVVYSLPLAGFMAQQFGRYSREKHLPEWVMLLPIEKQAELLKGFWRGDGSRNRHGHRDRFEMSTASRTLALQLSLILHRMGIPHGVYHYKQRDHYEIDIEGYAKKFAEIIGEKFCGKENNSKFARVTKDAIILRFQKAPEKYEGVVCNLEVNPDPSYNLVNICVHNCPGQRRGFVPKQLGLSSIIFFSLKKFRKEKIRLVASTHNFGDLHKPVRDSFNFYIIRKMRKEAVPERFQNYAALIEKLEINQGIVVDETGAFNRMEFPLYVKPRNISVKFEGDIEEPMSLSRSEILAEKYRERLALTAQILLETGAIDYAGLAKLWGVKESQAWKIVHGRPSM